MKLTMLAMQSKRLKEGGTKKLEALIANKLIPVDPRHHISINQPSIEPFSAKLLVHGHIGQNSAGLPAQYTSEDMLILSCAHATH